VLEALGRDGEVGRLGEHAVEEQAQRELGALAQGARRPRLAAGLDVRVDALEALQGAQRGGVRLQAGEPGRALGDERAGQRAVAVQRRAPPAALGGELERDLGPRRHLGREGEGGVVDEGTQRGVQGAISHGPPSSGPGPALLRGARRAARLHRDGRDDVLLP
jgi:hypothetical protein